MKIKHELTWHSVDKKPTRPGRFLVASFPGNTPSPVIEIAAFDVDGGRFVSIEEVPFWALDEIDGVYAWACLPAAPMFNPVTEQEEALRNAQS